MEIPVYLFTGFLEAGKTRLIQETMEDKEFNAGESTLLLLCEEGEEVLDPSSFTHGAENVFVRTVGSREEFTAAALSTMQKEINFRRVLIECNGMWMLDDVYRNLPKDWAVYQEIMLVDANTFPAYNANMRTLAVDKLQGCEMVVFNRCARDFDKMTLHKIVRGISRSVNISYEYTDGIIEYDDIEDPLPFDTGASVVDIEDRDFALFYRDLTEDMEKYKGKTVRFRGLIARDKKLKADTFAAGRRVMTCCANDITYRGFISITGGPVNFKTGDWAMLEGRIEIEMHKVYRTPGPVFYVEKAEKAAAPEEEVATFY